MKAMAWKRRLTARLLRLPAAGIARRRVVDWLRRSTKVRSLVKRIFAIDTAAQVPLDVTAGRVLGGVGTELLPVVLVVMIDAETETIARTVDEIAQIQIMSAGFRPVLVFDGPAFAAARRYGYPVELLLPRADWDAADLGVSWEEYVRRRLALLFATYRASASITVRPDGLDSSTRLLLGSLRPESALA